MKFLDEAKVFLKSGDGGAGAVSFRREKFVEFGGPDGGNGGTGGDVIIECVNGLNTLIDYRYQQHFKAKKGDHGHGRNKSGRAGDSITLKVPVGTQILDDDRETLIADFTEVGQKQILLKGGDGGKGNTHYKSSTNQAPRKATPGFPGQEAWIWLRLKLIADVGLLGMPNAGKSTFLSTTSRAKPKIADYPFTTLVPNLGVVKSDDQEFVIADIPGLIEGAHEGAGLGHKFLGHVERSKVLLHLVDLTDENMIENYKIIRKELEAYDHTVAEKQEVIALTKADAFLPEEIIEKKEAFEDEIGKQVFVISAINKTGIKPLLRALVRFFD